MEPVIQEHPEGCMLACAAMLANRPYGEVSGIARTVGMRAGDKRLYTSIEPMRHLLAELDIQAAATTTSFEAWGKLPDRCLLAIKWHIEATLPHWHWVVFAREGSSSVVLDPAAYLKTNRRTDFWRIKPKWFLEVTCEKEVLR